MGGTFTCGSAKDFEVNDMKEIFVNDIDILIGRNKDGFFAMDAKCSHYGAPLVNGSMSDNTVICPWHHACFSNKNGHLTEPPGANNLKTYPVSIKDGLLEVSFSDEEDEIKHYHVETSEHFVIIGGGDAGFHATKSLRENGFKGKVTLISADKHAPYDRTKCSKAFPEEKVNENQISLKSPRFYTEYSIELSLGDKVVNIDRENKSITTNSGKEVSYDKILIATGSKPRTLSVTGADSTNVFTLRNIKDTNSIIEKVKNASKAVVIGSSFIGLEVASALIKENVEVHVVSREEIPFASKWGDEIGQMLLNFNRENGVNFHLESEIKELLSDSKGQVTSVLLTDGVKIDTDLVIVGIGVTPATDFLDGFMLEEDGSLSVDEYLKMEDSIFVAGDVATFPYQDEMVRIEHWRHAAQQGIIAGGNMAGKLVAFDKVPFFWTAQHGENIRYVGYVKDYDRIIYDGDVNEKKFIAFFIKEGSVKAVLGMGRDKDIASIELLMQNNKMPIVDDIVSGKFDWDSLL